MQRTRIFAVILGLLMVCPAVVAQKRKGHPAGKNLSAKESRQAQTRLAQMGYGRGPTALIAFQKYAERNVSGRFNRDEFEAIMNAEGPVARDSGYKHVEVDLDRQILVL